MVRVKRGNATKKNHKKILNSAKGFKGSHSKLFCIANQQVMKSLLYSYIGRKEKKRKFRQLWITRINAAVRLNKMNYSQFINKLKISRILLNRKMLSQLAIVDPLGFSNLLQIF